MSTCFKRRNEFLYVVLPYFNFCGFKRRRQLFVEFIKKIEKIPGIRMVVAENIGPAPLPTLNVYLHHKVNSPSVLWLKENLVNIAVGHLPSDWKYVAWIDADITFLNENWVKDTIRELDIYDVVQLFRTCVNLGPQGEAIKIDKSFGYMHRDSNTPYLKTDKYGFWHPGYGWACNRKAWNQMNGLLDWAILGSGDRHMAMSFIGKALDSAPGNIHKNYKNMLVEFQKKCENLEVSYIDGTILHHWHGKFEDRKYRERWEILTKNKFDPIDDIEMSDDGIIHLTMSGERIQSELNGYFIGRREDGV